MESISNSEIVLFGGRSGGGGDSIMTQTYVYEIDTDSWRTTNAMIRPRRGMACQRWVGLINIFLNVN